MSVHREPYPACWTWPLPTADWDRPKHGWLAIAAWQHGYCAICGRHKSQLAKRSWHQDHDHDTGALRGWLCRSCNVMEGRAAQNEQPFARYRLINPGTILSVVEPYVNPYTGEPSIPWPEYALEDSPAYGLSRLLAEAQADTDARERS